MSHVEEAKRLLKAGVSVCPIPKPFKNGNKAMTFPWERYKHKAMTAREAEMFFETASGLAIICGNVSGRWADDENGELTEYGLTVLDFDQGEANVYSEFALEFDLAFPGLLTTLPTEATLSGGIHVFYLAPNCQGNQKLAARDRKTLIETRGEGGLIFCAPTEGYRVLWGDFADIPCVSAAQAETMLSIARSLGEPMPEMDYKPVRKFVGTRDSDRFNVEADWRELLREAGAKCRTRSDGRLVVTRPGKSEGVSATTGWGLDGVDRMYVFTTNWPPLEPERTVTKFAFVALTKYGGDFRKAAQELFPKQPKRKSLTYTFEVSGH